ncbi:MAG: glycoside hydrolase family 16 protein [Bacilli bacterium]|nr:glycoside hydrolase family 16 protein [Bacilli bacterium]MDD4808541.1 glycoside hydrolase family 16 protein [Bacilli bacterium]
MKKLNILKIMILMMITLFIYIIMKKPPEKKYIIKVTEIKKENNLVEDFNHDLNKDHWNVIERGNNYNNELQYYSSNNVMINNGILELTAKKESLNNHSYTSGMITTKDKYEFLYGKIIVKVKSASGKGLLSAIWLLPADDALYPEVDILESLGEKPNEIWTGVHYINEHSQKTSYFNTYHTNSDFSIYEINWEKDEIRCYLDNKLVYKTNVGVPDQKMYLIINLAVGGNWPKQPDDSIFPRSLLIDYIVIIPEVIDKS